MGQQPNPEPRILGRYALHDEIASGGMATVHFGRLLGPVGFSRTVAIKRLHPQFAKDGDFVSMFLDEARLAARVKHPNVVSIVDVVALEDELFLVMDYVPGESLHRLRRLVTESQKPMPVPIAVGIAVGMLCGLHAAHEAKDERGEPLQIVHRDVSPQNVLVGADGVPRLLDFGIAKATGRLQTTREGQIKGKLSYMAPEQILRRPVDRRTDVYAASIVLWYLLTGRRPFEGDEASLIYQILHPSVAPPSELAPHVPPELDALVMRGMSLEADQRFATAQEMAEELERVVHPATSLATAAWLAEVAGPVLRKRAAKVLEIEGATSSPKQLPPPILEPPVEAMSPDVDARGTGMNTVTLAATPLAKSSLLKRLSSRSVAIAATGVALFGVALVAAVAVGGQRAGTTVEPAAAIAKSPEPTSTPAPGPTVSPEVRPEPAATSSSSASAVAPSPSPQAPRGSSAGRVAKPAPPAPNPKRRSGEKDYGF